MTQWLNFPHAASSCLSPFLFVPWFCCIVRWCGELQECTRILLIRARCLQKGNRSGAHSYTCGMLGSSLLFHLLVILPEVARCHGLVMLISESGFGPIVFDQLIFCLLCSHCTVRNNSADMLHMQSPVLKNKRSLAFTLT